MLDLCAQMIVLRLRELSAPETDAPKKLGEIFAALRRNPAAEISAKSLAKRLAVSVYELDKLSLSLCGAKFKKAAENIKMERARAMLRKMAPVAEVAKAVGFADQAAFSKAFKRFHKIPPSRYQGAEWADDDGGERSPSVPTVFRALNVCTKNAGGFFSAPRILC